MSSAEATADNAVRATTTVRTRAATRGAAVFALLALTELTWLGALVYGVIWLLT